MQITLNGKKTPMFFFNDASHSIHLTYVDPGPVDINYEILSDENKNYILAALNEKLITSNVPIQEVIFKSIPTPEPKLEPEVEQPAKTEFQLRLEAAQEKARVVEEKQRKEAEYLLSKQQRGITQKIKDIKNVQQINMMITMEREGACRATVLDALNKQKEILINGKKKTGPKPGRRKKKDAEVINVPAGGLVSEVEEEEEDLIEIRYY